MLDGPLRHLLTPALVLAQVRHEKASFDDFRTFLDRKSFVFSAGFLKS